MSDYNHYDDQYEDQDYNYVDCQVEEYDNELPDMNNHNSNQSVYDDYGQPAYTLPIDYRQYQYHGNNQYEPQHPTHTDQYPEYDRTQLTHPDSYSQHADQYPMHNDHYGEYLYVSNIYHNPPEECAAETNEYDGNTESLALHHESMVPEPPTVNRMYASPPKTISHQMGSLSTFDREILEQVYAKVISMEQEAHEMEKVSKDIQSQTQSLCAIEKNMSSDLQKMTSNLHQLEKANREFALEYKRQKPKIVQEVGKNTSLTTESLWAKCLASSERPFKQEANESVEELFVRYRRQNQRSISLVPKSDHDLVTDFYQALSIELKRKVAFNNSSTLASIVSDACNAQSFPRKRDKVVKPTVNGKTTKSPEIPPEGGMFRVSATVYSHQGIVTPPTTPMKDRDSRKVHFQDANVKGPRAKFKIGYKTRPRCRSKKSRAVVKWNNNIHGPFGHYKTIPNSSNQTWNSTLKHGEQFQTTSSNKQFDSNLYKDKSNVYGPSGQYRYTNCKPPKIISHDSGTQLACKTTNVKGPMAKYKSIFSSSDSYNPNTIGLIKDATNASGDDSKYNNKERDAAIASGPKSK